MRDAHVVQIDRHEPDGDIPHDGQRDQQKQPADECDAALSPEHETLPLPKSADYSIREPIRLQTGPPLRSQSQLNQIRVALPTRFASGTKPQYRPSSLLSRLSPIMR